MTLRLADTPAPRVKGAELGPGDRCRTRRATTENVPNAPSVFRERIAPIRSVGWSVVRLARGSWLVSRGWGVQIVCGRVFDVRLESL